MGKPTLLYFSCLSYSRETLIFLNKRAHVVTLKNPNDVQGKNFHIDGLFAPLGYLCSREYLKKFPNLKCVISNTTGIPHIDNFECQKRNIFISALHDDKRFLEKITPTAEHTIGLIMAAHRKLIESHNSVVIDYEWNRRKHGAPYMLSRADRKSVV